jgi:Chalcone isomerase like
MRALQSRLIWCKQQGLLTLEEEQNVQSPLRAFKSMFPTTSLSKHKALDILITAPSAEPRTVVVRDLGSVQSDWIARELVLAYFEGQGLSPKVRLETISAHSIH